MSKKQLTDAQVLRRADMFEELLLALKMTAGICAGENLTKSYLTWALEKSRDVLQKAKIESETIK